MIAIQSHSFDLPHPTSVRFFSSDRHFLRKVRKHFVSENEPWGRLLGAKFLERLRRKLDAEDVSMLSEAYQLAASVLSQGLSSATERPVFLLLHQEVTPPNICPKRMTVVHLLADRGFRIVVHSGVLQTAFFTGKSRHDSYFSLYRETWRSMRQRALVRQYPRGGKVIHTLSVDWHSSAHWSRCPNPHAPPAHPRRIPDDSITAWLDQVDEVSR